MSGTIQKLVWDRYPIGGSKKMLLLAMAHRADDDGSSVYYTVATLARKCVLKARQVQVILRQLEAEGMIEAYAYRKGGYGKATHYRVRLSALEALPVYGLEDQYGASECREDANAVPCTPAQSTLHSSAPNISIKDINKKNNNARDDLFDEQSTKKPRKRFSYEREMPLPEYFCITAELYAWADKKGYQDIDRHLDRFIAHHGAKGSKFKDWQYAYQNWVIKDAQFAANRQASNQQRQTYKSRKEQAKEEFDAFRDELYRSAKQPIIQPQPERDPNTRDVFDAEWTVIDGADEDPPCPF